MKMTQEEWAEVDRVLALPESQEKLRAWMIENGVFVFNDKLMKIRPEFMPAGAER